MPQPGLLPTTLLLLAGSTLAAPVPGSPVWQRQPTHAGPARAVAASAGGALAVADAERLRLGRLTATGVELLGAVRLPGIRALAFDAAGGLWIAGELGIHRVEAGTSVARRADGVPAASRIASAGGLWLAATAEGPYRWTASGDWRRISGDLPAGAATALAVSGSSTAARVGLVIERSAYWGTLARTESGESLRFVPDRSSRVERAVDVGIDPATGRGATLREDGCVLGTVRGCAPLPPGATAWRLFTAGGRWWVTSERGVFAAPDPAGPWRREAPPFDALAVHDLVAGPAGLVAASERGLHRALPSGPAGTRVAGALSDLPERLRGEWREPSIDEVRRAALAYLDLRSDRLRRLQHGAARRGWLPTVSLRLDRDRVVSVNDDRDEAFVSGGLRHLVDFERERRSEFGASLSLTWDLGDVLHHPESVDVSRELRELLELRDDVLDELRHLYFERRRVLLDLLSLPADRPLEAARLRLRADELAAGIDAWTGGWFGPRAAVGRP